MRETSRQARDPDKSEKFRAASKGGTEEMRAFTSVLEKYDIKYKDTFKRGELTTLQVNMGNLCNQHCVHCHIEASAQGKNIMGKSVMEDILIFLSQNKIETLDITGGAPELNPRFDFFIANARGLVKELIVRSNLTVFFEADKEYLPEFFRKHRVHLICSLPCYSEKNVDSQRGNGVFQKSISALKLLNKIGYAMDEELKLDLAHNPLGAYLPASQEELESAYRLNLSRDYAINFNRLITLTNVPIKRFKSQLELNSEYGAYLKLLEDNFNPDTVTHIMCRNFLSVGYDGLLYDCDFNQALGWALKDGKGNFLTINSVTLDDLKEREIMAGEHCLSCTAGFGSSCQGALSSSQSTAHSPQSAENKYVSVKEYYGKILKTKQDLKTSACCSSDSLPKNLRKIASLIDPQIQDKFYGCGSPIPPLLEGCRVLDLGAGSGRDVYIASYLAGENGFVTGVDMTDEQLEIANKHINNQMKKFGFKKPNVEFKKGYIENLKEIGIKDNSMDIVISNCVINLSPDKEAVFREIFRVLKYGGELYFSDVFSDRRIPAELKQDPVLYGECLAGALYLEDCRRILQQSGCMDHRIVHKNKIAISDSEAEEKLSAINFYSITIRAFKLDLEDRCEDYGQMAVYLGGIPGYPHQFALDDHHIFLKGKPAAVCGNTADMLGATRFCKHFKIIGRKDSHYGLFNCAPKQNEENESAGGACC